MEELFRRIEKAKREGYFDRGILEQVEMILVRNNLATVGFDRVAALNAIKISINARVLLPRLGKDA